MAGGRIDVEVAPDLRHFPAQLESGMRGAMGVATKIGGALGVALSVGAGAKAVLDLGNSFTNELNTLQAVSGATADQLQKVRDAAMGLGNDASLADTSATDAAAAMTELAKGGFSVDQAMGAARGTLQLAAAAQIDAASAATIQSQALQAFGLDADYAAKAADVLANGANASSAEITDVAQGLQQAGAVANQFGLTLEDTVAGLGLLANAGIQGSDAGTLIKSTLLALTDTGKPAQAAIRDLGLEVYDAQGRFVGLGSLFEQLEDAAGQMTPELYQAATATLFGSDAMRLAGIAADDGAAKWDTMREAIDRQGSAAEVAASKTQGLPGAMAGVQNAAEGLALSIYDVVDGPLQSFATKGAEFITAAAPQIVSGLSSVVDIAGEVGSALAPAAGVVGDLAAAFLELPAPIQLAVAGIASMKAFGGDDRIGTWVDGIKDKFEGFREQMDAVRLAMAESQLESEGYDLSGETQSVEQLGVLLAENEEQISDVAAAWSTLEARSPAIARMGESYRGVTARSAEFAQRQREAATESGRMVGALRNAGAAAVTFGGRVGGVAAAGLSGMRSAAGNVISAFGGPWMVGLAAAGMAVSGIIAEVQRAERQNTLLSDATERAAASQRDLAKAFVESKGLITDDVLAVATESITKFREEQEQLADTAPAWYAGVVEKWNDMLGSFNGEEQRGRQMLAEDREVAGRAERISNALNSLGMESDELASTLAGSRSGWDIFIDGIDQSTEGGAELVASLQGQREEFERTQRVAQQIEPEYLAIRDAIEQIAESAGNSEQKVAGLKRILDILAGGQVSYTEALDEYNQTIIDVAESTQQVVDQSQGYGSELIAQNGTLATNTKNGQALSATLRDLADASVEVAEAAYQQAITDGSTVPEAQAKAREAMAQTELQLAALAEQYNVPIEKVREFAAARGYLPEDLIFHLAVEGADEVTKKLVEVRDQLIRDPDNVIKLPIDDEGVKEVLRGVGLQLRDLPDGIVEIKADSELAVAGLEQVIRKTLETGGTMADVKVTADTTEFDLNVDQAKALIAQLDAEEANPAVGAILDKLKEGKAITLADLQELDKSTATPEVKAAVAQAIADLDSVQIHLAGIKDKNVNVTINIDEVRRTASTYGAGSRQALDAAGLTGMSPDEYERIFGRRPPGRERGGRMPTTGPGTETTDGIYAVDPSGMPIAMVDGGEWVIRSEMSDKYDRELAMMNAGTFPKLPGFETGGRIAVNRATSYLSGEDGKEYQYGGVGSPSWDCSGYVSAGYAMLTGRDPNTRWFTTESDFNALGFEDGPGPRSALNIGVMRGGGGMYSHMAATLDGIPFESGGAGVVFGHSTLGADDPNLPLKWHLPVSAFVPPGDESSAGGGYERRRPRNRETWDEQDDLKLDSARIAVQQAIESRDKAMNDPKKSQADKDQAENKVAQAEAKVRELEEKKRAAESGASISPEAPELLTNLTDEELRLRSLERAVDEARWDRNDVYADPESTKFERDEADDKLQTAINALREEQVEQRDELAPAAPALRGRMTDDQIRLVELEQAVKEAEQDRNAVYADPRSTDDERLAADLDLQKALNARDEGRKGGSGSGSGVKSLGAVGLELAEVFAGGVLETFGLEDSPLGFVPKLLFGSGDIGGPLLEGIGTTGIPAMIAQQQVGPAVAPTFSDAEIATQGPVVPGSPGWLEELVNSLRIPAVLRDAGGPLPHGMAGLNLSGETEWVQTAEDKRRYDRDMRELAALRAGASGASGAALEQLGQRQESLLKSLGQLATRRGHTINAYGMDPDKVGRQIEQVLRRDSLAQMSMGGLPG
ncbi:phage tail tape measure protein [Rhodococcus sp. YH1]|uniref:phage tail tape measure protein n=1 Tax=Rhodococcus sp. YH1 TaxID=89066 RepID=UPI0019E13953|nr:hypothetical protein [Rhodococcus sp. YH1]NCL78810.1 hypothetical protein [Rhodococcus sp. YH1]